MGCKDNPWEKVSVFDGISWEFIGTLKLNNKSSAGEEGAASMATQLMKFDYKKLEKLVKYYNELNGRKPYIICNNKTAAMFINDISNGEDTPWSISLNDLVVFGSRVLVDHGLKDYEVEVR